MEISGSGPQATFKPDPMLCALVLVFTGNFFFQFHYQISFEVSFAKQNWPYFWALINPKVPGGL